ncbi:MAG: translin family protein [Nanobdellota archaeon]
MASNNSLQLDSLKKELSIIKESIDQSEKDREYIINSSRQIQQQSKRAIHSLHRDDFQTAKQLLSNAQQSLDDANTIIEQSQLQTVGSLSACMEEFVEAKAYYQFLNDQTIPTREQLGLSFIIPQEKYLLGLCDLPGELARKALLYATNEEFENITPIYAVIDELNELFLQFNFRSGEFRKKIESIKYQLHKVQQIRYDIAMNRAKR